MAIQYPDNVINPIAKMVYRKLRRSHFSVYLWGNIYNQYPKNIESGV